MHRIRKGQLNLNAATTISGISIDPDRYASFDFMKYVS